jgi:hypothetical protein
MFAKDISLDEISKVIKILKPYQSVIKNCCSLYTVCDIIWFMRIFFVVDNMTSSAQIGYQK